MRQGGWISTIADMLSEEQGVAERPKKRPSPTSDKLDDLGCPTGRGKERSGASSRRRSILARFLLRVALNLLARYVERMFDRDDQR